MVDGFLQPTKRQVGDVSLFASAFVFHWRNAFGDKVELKYPPTFDSSAVLHPTTKNSRDSLSWRQADYHIISLHNMAFWTWMLKGNLSPAVAEEQLQGTVSADQNELLFTDFGLNYNNQNELFRKGTVIVRWKDESVPCSKTAEDEEIEPVFVSRLSRVPLQFQVRNCDVVIGDTFWEGIDSMMWDGVDDVILKAGR